MTSDNQQLRQHNNLSNNQITSQSTNQPNAILGIGNALVDALIKIENDELLANLKLKKGAMNLVDEKTYLQLVEQIKDLSPEYVAGGSSANTIVATSALNIKSGFIGCIGKDEIGKIFEKSISDYDVVPHLTYGDGRTGVATTFISEDGERTFATYLGVASHIGQLSIKDLEFEKYSILYIEGYLVDNHQLMRELFKIAKKHNIRVALDIASFNIVEENKAFLDEIIPQYIDILFANEPEAMALAGKKPQDAIVDLAKMTKIAVIKMGKNGSYIGHNDTFIHIKAVSVDKVVDTTGAGDLYSAGFLFGLCQDFNLPLCGKIGTLMASKIITKIGPKLSVQEWVELKKDINNLINDQY